MNRETHWFFGRLETSAIAAATFLAAAAAPVAFLTESAWADGGAATGQRNNQYIIFSQDSAGFPKVYEENAPVSSALPHADDSAPQPRLFGLSEQEKFDEFTRAIYQLLKGAYGAVCDLALLPTSVTLSAEVVSATWEQKHLCSKSSQDALGILTTAEEASTRSLTPVFRLPSALNASADPTRGFNGAQSPSILGIPGQIKVQKEFLANVAKFFCELAVRPSEVDVKIPPLKVEWNLDTMCKKNG